ncbi:MAG TPA: DNA-3-methyladenine glycosylase I, partial [Planctomycetota bacterium]|nr:DNA-3-methyladenine glycosylase I [Planctomycetota bacterium]
AKSAKSAKTAKTAKTAAHVRPAKAVRVRADLLPVGDGRMRCGWARNELSAAYHDAEWGVPLHDERRLFEFVILEGMQAGLSWDCILGKRIAFRAAFAQFDPTAVARFTARDIARLMNDAGIIRNRQKIEAAIGNARAFLAVQEEFGSFDTYAWPFIEGHPLVNRWSGLRQLPARTAHSDAWSKDLKARGFKFVGSTIVYAHMQATGMVNDHLVGCFRHAELLRGR